MSMIEDPGSFRKSGSTKWHIETAHLSIIRVVLAEWINTDYGRTIKMDTRLTCIRSAARPRTRRTDRPKRSAPRHRMLTTSDTQPPVVHHGPRSPQTRSHLRRHEPASRSSLLVPPFPSPKWGKTALPV